MQDDRKHLFQLVETQTSFQLIENEFKIKQMQFIKVDEDFRHWVIFLGENGSLYRGILSSSLDGINIMEKPYQLAHKQILSFYAITQSHFLVIVEDKQHNHPNQLLSMIIHNNKLVIQGTLWEQQGLSHVAGLKLSRNVKLYKVANQKISQGFYNLKILSKQKKEQIYILQCVIKEGKGQITSHFYYDPKTDTVDLDKLQQSIRDIQNVRLSESGQVYLLQTGNIEILTQQEAVQFTNAYKYKLEGKYDFGENFCANTISNFPTNSTLGSKDVNQHINSFLAYYAAKTKSTQQQVLNKQMKQVYNRQNTQIETKVMQNINKIVLNEVQNLQCEIHDGFYHIFDDTLRDLLANVYQNSEYCDQNDKQLEDQIFNIINKQIRQPAIKQNKSSSKYIYIIQEAKGGKVELLQYQTDQKTSYYYQIPNYSQQKDKKTSDIVILFREITYFKVIYDKLVVISTQTQTYLYIISFSTQYQQMSDGQQLNIIQVLDFGEVQHVYHYQRKLLFMLKENKCIVTQVNAWNEEAYQFRQNTKYDNIDMYVAIMQLQYFFNFNTQCIVDTIITQMNQQLNSYDCSIETDIIITSLGKIDQKHQQIYKCAQKLLKIYAVKLLVNNPQSGLHLWYQTKLPYQLVQRLFKDILYQQNNQELSSELQALITGYKEEFQLYQKNGENLIQLYNQLLQYFLLLRLRLQINEIKDKLLNRRVRWLLLLEKEPFKLEINEICIICIMLSQFQQSEYPEEIQNILRDLDRQILFLLTKLCAHDNTQIQNLKLVLQIFINIDQENFQDLLKEKYFPVFLATSSNNNANYSIISTLIDEYLNNQNKQNLDNIIKCFKMLKNSQASETCQIQEKIGQQCMKLFTLLYKQKVKQLFELLGTQFGEIISALPQFHEFLLGDPIHEGENLLPDLADLSERENLIVTLATETPSPRLLQTLIQALIRLARHQAVEKVKEANKMDDQSLKQKYGQIFTFKSGFLTQNLRKTLSTSFLGKSLSYAQNDTFYYSIEELHEHNIQTRKLLYDLISKADYSQINQDQVEIIIQSFPDDQLLQEKGVFMVKSGYIEQGIDIFIRDMHRLDLAEKYAYELLTKEKSNIGILSIIKSVLNVFNNENNAILIGQFQQQLQESVKVEFKELSLIQDKISQDNITLSFILSLLAKYLPHCQFTQMMNAICHTKPDHIIVQRVFQVLSELLKKQSREQKLLASALLKAKKFQQLDQNQQKQIVITIPSDQICDGCQKPLINNILIINKMYFCDQCANAFQQ